MSAKAVKDDEDMSFSLRDRHRNEIHVDDVKRSFSTFTMTDLPVSTFAINYFSFGGDFTGFYACFNVAILEFPPIAD